METCYFLEWSKDRLLPIQLLWMRKWNKLDTDIENHRSNFAMEWNIEDKQLLVYQKPHGVFFVA